MSKVGRPPTLNEFEIDEVVSKFKEYIEITQMPIVAEFAYLQNIPRTYLYDRAEFSTLIKRSQDKKQVYLEQMALLNKINPTMAIFSLKQLGWKDKQEIEHSGQVATTINLIPASKTKDK